MDEQTPAVLLIDADPDLHDQVAGALGSDFALLGARTVELALKVAGRRAPAVAVIDAQISTHTAEEIAAELRALSPNVRLVFLTSYHDPRETSRLTALGTLLPKPVDNERLKQAIKNAVRLQGMSAGVERLRTRTGQFAIPTDLPPPLPNKQTRKD
jgi:DNA-binding NtrC family response regulator